MNGGGYCRQFSLEVKVGRFLKSAAKAGSSEWSDTCQWSQLKQESHEFKASLTT